MNIEKSQKNFILVDCGNKSKSLFFSEDFQKRIKENLTKYHFDEFPRLGRRLDTSLSLISRARDFKDLKYMRRKHKKVGN